MAIAKLTIDLEARLAGLQQSLDKAGALAEKNSARMSRAFDGARTAALAVSGALGGLFTVGAAAAFVRQTGEAAEAITNLSRVAGTSTEDFQRYAFAARTVGIEQDKLSDILKDVQDKVGDFLQTGGGPLADFFEKIAPQIGVTAEQFRNLGGADALQLYVSSLEKANLSQSELVFFLEAIASDATLLLPLLRDNGRAMGELADRADRLGIVMDEKAIASAKEFNRNLAQLQEVSAAAARNIAGPLISALNEVFDTIAGKGPGQIAQGLAVPLQAISVLGANVAFVLKGIGRELGGIAAQAAAVARLDFEGAREIGRALREDGAQARREFDALERRLLQMGSAPQADYSNEGRNAVLPGVVVPRRGGGGGSAGRAGAAAGASGNAIADAEEGFNQLFQRYWERNQEALDRADEAAARDAQAVREEIERAARASYEATRTPLERLNIELARQQDLLNALGPSYRDTYERAVFAAQDAFDAATQVSEAVKEADTFAKDLGLTFSSAFEDAIVSGNGLRDVLQGLEQDILRIVTRKLVTEPLGNALTDIIGGFIGGGSGGGSGNFVTNILGSLFGGFFADGGYLPPGRWGVAGERGPEPIFGGRTGVTVQPSGGSMHVVQNFHLSGPADRSTQAQLAAAAARGLQMAAARNN